MSQKVFRITYTDYFPMFNPNCPRISSARSSSRCLLPGLAIEMFDLLATYLNLTIEARWFNKKIDQYNFIFDDIRNNLTDTYAHFFEESDVRKDQFEFSSHLYNVKTHYIVKRTDHSLKNIFDFFNVYQMDAWLSMLGVFILFTSFGLCVRFTEWRLALRPDRRLFDVVWRMVRFQLIQSDGIAYKLKAGRISLLVFSLFQLCIILGLFQGFILTSVVKHKKSRPFDIVDFPQLLKDKKYYIVTANLLDWHYLEINTSYATPFYELRDALKTNPYRVVDSNKHVMERILYDERAVALVQDDQGLFFESHKYCDVLLLETTIPPGLERIMFLKGTPWKALFDEAIKVNRVLLRRIYQKYSSYRPPVKCRDSNTDPNPLTMGPYYGVLILFSIGIISAFMIFGIEVLKRTNKLKMYIR